jgi:hypothetical protein
VFQILCADLIKKIIMENQQTQQPGQSKGRKALAIIAITLTVFSLTIFSCSPSRESNAAEIAAQQQLQNKLVNEQEAFQQKVLAAAKVAEQKTDSIVNAAGQK